MTTETKTGLEALQEAADQLNSREELSQAYQIIRDRDTYLSTRKAKLFKVGEKVKFEGRRNKILTGEITKINSKTVSVKVMEKTISVRGETVEVPRNWRVDAGLLTRV